MSDEIIEARAHISKRVTIERTMHILCSACHRFSEYEVTPLLGNLVRCQNCNQQIVAVGRFKEPPR